MSINSLNSLSEGQSWIFQIPPEPGESFGHYLGRFRRANCLSRSGLAELMALDSTTVRGWETPSLDRPPRGEQLKKVSALIGVSEAELLEMLPGERSQVYLETRLCPACYTDNPIHQKHWQQVKVTQCDRHHNNFLTVCPDCGTSFRLPALWENGCCERCWLPFRDMQPLRHEKVD
jgi:transcriptional regulator with XRE-family HTH domain